MASSADAGRRSEFGVIARVEIEERATEEQQTGVAAAFAPFDVDPEVVACLWTQTRDPKPEMRIETDVAAFLAAMREAKSKGIGSLVQLVIEIDAVRGPGRIELADREGSFGMVMPERSDIDAFEQLMATTDLTAWRGARERGVAAIVQAASGPADVDFGEILLRLLIESPLVRELEDGRFAYEPLATKGVAGDDATTVVEWRDTDAGTRVRAAVYSKDAWTQPFYMRRYPYKNPGAWEKRRKTFKATAEADHAFKFMRMSELPPGYTYHWPSVHRRRKAVSDAAHTES